MEGCVPVLVRDVQVTALPHQQLYNRIIINILQGVSMISLSHIKSRNVRKKLWKYCCHFFSECMKADVYCVHIVLC